MDKPIPEAVELLRAFQSQFGARRPDEDEDDAETWDRIDAVCKSLTAAQQQGQAKDCHCATCTCHPGMTPAVRFDTTPADKEGAVRDHLIALGWTPPGAQQPAAEAQGGGDVVQRLRGVLQHAKMGNSYLISQDLIHKAIGAITAPPSAPVGVEGLVERMRQAPSRLWRADLIGQQISVERMRDILAFALAQQPAAVDEGFVSRLAEALTDQDWDVDPDGDGSGIAQLRAAVVAAQHQEPTT